MAIAEAYDSQSDVQRQAEQQEKLSKIANRLDLLAQEQRGKKSLIEERWLADLRQYRGRYPADVEQVLRDEEKSRVFANITRKLTRAWIARISDMLFPSDDKNWGIQPTPVPRLADEAQRAIANAEQAAQQANDAREMGNQVLEQHAVQRGIEAAEDAARLQDEIDEAERRGALMEAEMEDELRECDYNIRARKGIRDLAKLGTNVMKGPIISEKRRRKWSVVDPTDEEGNPIVDEAGNPIPGEFKLGEENDPRPEYKRIDPWLYYPDMNSRDSEEKEFDFELHPLTTKQLRKLGRRDDFFPDAVRRVLTQTPKETLPDWWSRLREIGEGDDKGSDPRYLVWEYHGPLEKDEIRTLISETGDEEWLDEIVEDPLTEMNVIVWFCQGEVIKFGPHPMDSGDSLYSVCPFEEDDTSIFGFGVPYLLRNSQSVQNGAWRMMMNNAGLATGPQIFINQKAVEPADGEWELKPMKVWLIKEGVAANTRLFEQFQPESRQGDLERIIQINRQFADDEVSLPLIATGESQEGATVQTTAQGVSILMNAANVTFRDVVKNYDDYMTTPNIRRLYDWNMQHNPRDDIKGDMEVDARGSSVLLVRELQTQNMLMLLREARQDPDLARHLRKDKFYRSLLQTMSLRAGDMIKTVEEVEEDDRIAAENAEPPLEIQLEQIKMENMRQSELARAEREITVEGMRQETAMMKLAQESNLKLEEIEARREQIRTETAARLAAVREQIASSERKLAAEAALTNYEKTKGGGGTL